MKKFIIIIITAIIAACSPLRYVPVETKTEVRYVDSLILHRDTISVEIPREVVKEVVYADSSHLETSVASSDAWVDSLSILHHALVNKAENTLKKEIVYLDKISVRDSIQIVEKPYPVEVEKKYIPKWCWYSLIINICMLILGIAIFFFKNKKIVYL